MRNWLRSSSTCLRPFAMNSSNRSVKRAIRSRRSSKPKSILGRVSAIEGSGEGSVGRILLVERAGSKTAVIFEDDECNSEVIGAFRR